MPKLTKEQIKAINNSYNNYINQINDKNYRDKFKDFVNQTNQMLQIKNLTEANKNDLIGVYLAATTVNRMYRDFDFASEFTYAKQNDSVYEKTGVNVDQLESLYNNREKLNELDDLGEDGKQIENVEIQRPEPIDLLNIDNLNNLDNNIKEEEKKELVEDPNDIVIQGGSHASESNIDNDVNVDNDEIDYLGSFNYFIGIDKDENKNMPEELKAIRDRVEKSGMDALNSSENYLKYYSAYEIENGKFVGIDFLRSGINVMDQAQSEYNKINIFKRALSHLGFFSDVTKKREDINKMKDVLNKQFLDDKTIDGIRKGTITELPKKTIDLREQFKTERSRYLTNYVQGLHADAKHFIKEYENTVVSEYNKGLIEQYDVKEEMNQTRDRVKELKESMTKTYGIDSYKKSNDQKFIEELQSKSKEHYDNYKKDYKELTEKYSLVHDVSKQLSKEDMQVKFLMHMLEGSNYDYNAGLNSYKEDYEQKLVNKQLVELNEKGIISKQEKDKFYIEPITEINKNNNLVENGKDDINENLNINNVEKAKDNLKKLSDDTNMEKTDAKISDTKRKEPEKQLEVGPKANN